jgi:hypothetical protein
MVRCGGHRRCRVLMIGWLAVCWGGGLDGVWCMVVVVGMLNAVRFLVSIYYCVSELNLYSQPKLTANCIVAVAIYICASHRI